MNDHPPQPRRLKFLLIALVVVALAAPLFWWMAAREQELPPSAIGSPPAAPVVMTDTADTIIDWMVQPAAPPQPQPPHYVQAACGVCHLVPPPDIIPRDVWEPQVERMFGLAPRFDITLTVDPKQVLAWYQQHAPDRLPEPGRRGDASGGRLATSWWQFATWKPGGAPPPPQDTPGVSHLAFERLAPGPTMQMIVCDMRHNVVMSVNPVGAPGNYLLLAQLASPSRATIADLDSDGLQDLVVGELGAPLPTDALIGKVTWLRARGDQTFEKIHLLEGIPRVADVRAADLDADGDTDLAVAVFGWMKVGHVMWMENVTPAGTSGQPTFRTHILDPRPGAIHVPILDFDGDGDLDIISLISQHHEQVVLYRREADGYVPQVLHHATHPNWGYTGIDPVDIDGDGDTDFVLTNGDSLDDFLPKPYHGVSLLENRGEEGMVHRHLTPMYGVHRAIAADYDGDGDLDIMAVANVAHDLLQTEYAPRRIEGAILLERIGPTRFRRHVLVPDRADFGAIAVGDVDGDGRLEFALGGLSYEIEVRHYALPFWAMIARQHPAGPLVQRSQPDSDGR